MNRPRGKGVSPGGRKNFLDVFDEAHGDIGGKGFHSKKLLVSMRFGEPEEN